METTNMYLFKAMDAYPYELEKAVESLNYALAYDPENFRALCLMAKVNGEQLSDYETAKQYYERALTSRMDIPNIYPDYIRTLLMNDDFVEAQKLIDFAQTVKGIDRGVICLLQAQLFEALTEFTKAEVALKEAVQHGMNNSFITFVKTESKRIRKKRKIQEKQLKEYATAIKKVEKVTAVEKGWLRNRLNNLL